MAGCFGSAVMGDHGTVSVRQWPLCAVVLLASCAPAATRAPARSPNNALVTAIAPVVLDLMMKYERAASVWDILAEPVGDDGAAVLRDAITAATGARLRTPSDTIWGHLSIDHLAFSGDSVTVSLDLGTRWCTLQTGPAAVGLTHILVLVRSGADWRFRSSRPYIHYDPPPGPLPGQAGACTMR